MLCERCLDPAVGNPVQGYLAHEKTPPPQDPTVGVCLGPCGGPRGWMFSYERGTPVGPRQDMNGNFKEGEGEREGREREGGGRVQGSRSRVMIQGVEFRLSSPFGTNKTVDARSWT